MKVIRKLNNTDKANFLAEQAGGWVNDLERGEVLVMDRRPNWPKGRPGILKTKRADDESVYVWLEQGAQFDATYGQDGPPSPETALQAVKEQVEAMPEALHPDEPPPGAADLVAEAEKAFADV